MSTIPAWKASRLDLAAEDANVGYGGSIFLGHPGLVVT
jgi:hypothetical protein